MVEAHRKEANDSEYGYRNHSLTDKNLADTCMAVAERVVRRMLQDFPPWCDVEDLIAEGTSAAYAASKTYSGERGAKFETYATIRARGAVLDHLRRMDILTRQQRRRVREMDDAIWRLASTTGGYPAQSEIAKAMCLSQDALQEIRINKAGGHVENAGDGYIDLASDDCEPGTLYEQLELHVWLRRKLADLDRRTQMILDLYYNVEMTMREIGVIFGVTEGRICQIIGEAVRGMRKELVDIAGG